MVVDCFADIKRLKDFHNIEYTSKEKILAYTAYWLNKRRPIQIIGECPNDKYTYVNEAFISSFLITGISELIKSVYLSENLREHLYYHLIFRQIDAQNLEMLITSCVSVSRMK
jgi:hypothetical protein